jgi:hypothetical protein
LLLPTTVIDATSSEHDPVGSSDDDNLQTAAEVELVRAAEAVALSKSLPCPQLGPAPDTIADKCVCALRSCTRALRQPARVVCCCARSS